MFRRRVFESETETVSDYLSTPTPCGRHWLAVQPQSPHFTLHSPFPPPAQVEKRFPRFSLLLCTTLAGFSVLHFFFLQSHVPSFVLYHSQIVVTEFLAPVPSRPCLVRTKKLSAEPRKTKKGGGLRSPFLSLAYGIGI